jgi:hypothetical protein
VQFTIAGLTVSGGRAPIGGAIFDEGGALTIADDVLVDNQAIAVNSETSAQGGAIAVTGAGASFVVNESVVSGNLAQGADSLGGPAAGGGIFASAGTLLTVSGSVFSTDQVIGGAAGPGGSDFSNGMGGEADGGAIAAVSDGTTVSIRDSTFDENQALGGRGGLGGTGFINGTGGDGSGGALSVSAATFPAIAGSLTVTGSRFAVNLARGGAGGSGQGFSDGQGGSGLGGALTASSQALTVVVDGSSSDRNEAVGGVSAAALTG